jgi:hypothetical protein
MNNFKCIRIYHFYSNINCFQVTLYVYEKKYSLYQISLDKLEMWVDF